MTTITFTPVFLDRSIARLCALFAAAALGVASAPAAAAPFDISNVIIPSGTTPNGTLWSSLSSGTNPVAYFNWQTGELQIDPKAKDISAFTFNYGTNTVTGTTPGPYTYAFGTGTGAVSTNLIARTLPVGPWTAVTTFPARVAGVVSLTGSPQLGTTGDNTASTNGWFNEPWNFGALAPSIDTAALVTSNIAGEGFRATGGGVNDLLGYGTGVSMFSYTVNGVSGTGFGAVIPVQSVPEPSTIILAGLGLAAAAAYRRRAKR